ncbi:MAG TPA: hypothetical protein VLG49_06940, partial [Rhabdochlamydiaceae bacterium]|nr:hypothetical protein [Rhabdochlamydiaceae bacterium]
EEPINPKIVLEPASEDSGLYLSRTFYLNGESYEITKFDANGNLIAYDKNAWNEIEAAFKQDLVPIANNFTANVTKEAKFNLDSNQLLIEGKSDQAVECTLLKGACGRLETCDRLENRSKTVEYAAGKKPSPGSPFNHLLIKKVTGFTFDIDRVRGSDETGILKQKTADGEKFYRINARFKGNVLQDGTHPYSDSRLIGFQIRAKSLKVALEMIEAYGRQMEFEKRDDADFENIRTNFRNKTFEAVVKIDRNADRGKEAMITFFMQNHTRHGLDYAFGPKPGSNNHYGIKEMRVDQEHINIIKHKAKLRKISKKPNLPVNAKFILSEKDPQVI